MHLELKPIRPMVGLWNLDGLSGTSVLRDDQALIVDANDAPPVDWDALIELAKDVSSNDEMVETRMRSAATDIDAFIQIFIDEEPDLGDRFTGGWDTDHPATPLMVFAAVVTASGHLSDVDAGFPLSDIVFIFNNHAQDLGVDELNHQEVAALEAISPKDERQTNLFFHDVAPQLDRACVARGRRLLGWDDGSDGYGWFLVTEESFAKWAGTTIHEHYKLYDPSRFE